MPPTSDGAMEIRAKHEAIFDGREEGNAAKAPLRRTHRRSAHRVSAMAMLLYVVGASTAMCKLESWPSWGSKLKYCKSDFAPDTIDSDIHWLKGRISRRQRFNLGKMSRGDIMSTIQALRRIVNPDGVCDISCVWPLLSCALSNTQSQERQDLYLLPSLLSAASFRPGTFVEIGAYDGVNMSNTFMYERCFNWTGLLIEAQPDNFESLQYHSGRQSTKILSAVCASGTDPPVVRMTRPQSGHGNVAKQVKVSGINTVEVPCAPLSTIIDSTGLSREDIVFFSLDVEGAELDVLRTVSPSRFKIIMVETELNVKGVGQVSDRKTIEQVHQTIVSHGFRMAADHANINDANYNKNKVYRRRDVATPQRHW